MNASPAIEVVTVAHAASTFLLVGLIWFVQVVHYPLFYRVGSAELVRYEREHQRRTAMIVAPAMASELISAVLLVWLFEADRASDDGVARGLAWVGFAALLGIWAWTFGVMTPIHRGLAASATGDAEISRRIRLLVCMNIPRVAAWTARGVIAAWLTLRLLA